jgi:hypothetical protein
MFDLAVSTATLEFVRDQRQVLAECARVLTNRGALFLQTVNRCAVSSDPYVYLWGVGFLPRAWQARYVRWRRQVSYENIRLLSLRELNRIAAEHFCSREIMLPDVDTAVLDHFPPLTRVLVHLYRLIKRLPPGGWVLKGIGPGWDVKLRKTTAG